MLDPTDHLSLAVDPPAASDVFSPSPWWGPWCPPDAGGPTRGSMRAREHKQVRARRTRGFRRWHPLGGHYPRSSGDITRIGTPHDWPSSVLDSPALKNVLVVSPV